MWTTFLNILQNTVEVSVSKDIYEIQQLKIKQSIVYSMILVILKFTVYINSGQSLKQIAQHYRQGYTYRYKILHQRLSTMIDQYAIN